MPDIRQAEVTDCQLINKMASEVFPYTYQSLLTASQIEYMFEWMYSVDKIEKQIRENEHQYFIAYKNGEPCGYLSIEQQADNLYHLQKIYVLPAFQGQKIGRSLFDYAIRYIKKIHPAPCLMELNVNRNNNAAITFYKQIGMEILREGDFAIGNDFFMNDYIMGIEI